MADCDLLIVYSDIKGNMEATEKYSEDRIEEACFIGKIVKSVRYLCREYGGQK